MTEENAIGHEVYFNSFQELEKAIHTLLRIIVKRFCMKMKGRYSEVPDNAESNMTIMKNLKTRIHGLISELDPESEY